MDVQTHGQFAPMGRVSRVIGVFTLSTTYTFLVFSALKLRYLLPIMPPPKAQVPMVTGASTQASPESSTFRFPSTDPPIIFDAALVARREGDWEDMLQYLLLEWIQAVVVERRS